MKPAAHYVTARELCERFNYSRATLSRYRAAGLFPPPVRFSSRCLRWRLADIVAFETRLAADSGVRS
jgi:prophage regulatory protein